MFTPVHASLPGVNWRSLRSTYISQDSFPPVLLSCCLFFCSFASFPLKELHTDYADLSVRICDILLEMHLTSALLPGMLLLVSGCTASVLPPSDSNISKHIEGIFTFLSVKSGC